jgi:hypothetical protein
MQIALRRRFYSERGPDCRGYLPIFAMLLYAEFCRSAEPRPTLWHMDRLGSQPLLNQTEP